MAKCFVLLVWLVMPFLVHAQDEMIDVHRLIRECHAAKADTAQVDRLLQLSEIFLQVPEKSAHLVDTSLTMAKQAHQLSTRLQYASGIENASFFIGQCYLESDRRVEFNALLANVDDTTRIRLWLKQSDAQKKRDTGAAEHSVVQAIALSESIHSFRWQVTSRLRQATATTEKGNIALGKLLFTKIFNFCRSNRSLTGETETYAAMATQVSRDATLLKVMDTCRRQMLADYASLPGSTPREIAAAQISGALVDVSLSFWNSNLIDLSKQELLRGIEFGKQSGHPDIAPYFNIIYLYLYQSDFKTALAYALESMRIIEKTGNPQMDERPYMSLGKVYSDMRKPDLAIANFNQAMALIKKKGYLVNGMLLRMVAEAYIIMHKPVQALPLLLDYLQHSMSYERIDRQFVLETIGLCYFLDGQYERAEKYVLEDVRLTEQGSSLIDRYNAYEVLGKIYARQKKFDKSRHYLEQVLNNDSIAELLILKREAHHILVQSDSAEGNYLSALQHLWMYKNLDDSSFNDLHSKQTEELKMQYETEKKDQNIVMQKQSIQLLQKQSALQQAAMGRSLLMRNGLIIGSALLILLLATIYSRYRSKQKNHLLLQRQQEKINQSNRELQRLNEQQQKLLSEKEWLIKEVHHRVKNNLQLVISLLNMQGNYLKDGFTPEIFQEISNRIGAISLIHQKLYQVDDLATINMQDYVYELVRYLEESRLSPKPIRFTVNVDPINLEASQSVSIGLILNEAITNAIKYAFEKMEEGIVRIEMTRDNSGLISLSIADNGRGLPDALHLAPSDSMGMTLMQLLTEQLEGTMSLISDKGLHILIQFSPQQVSAVAEEVPQSQYTI